MELVFFSHRAIADKAVADDSSMVRFFLILMALALLVWFGQHYFVQHPNGGAFWDSFDSHMNSSTPPPDAPTAPPAARSVNESRTNLNTMAQKILQPLAVATDIPAPDIMRSLQDSQQGLGENKFDPDYNRLMQASTLLVQALNERQTYFKRYTWKDTSASTSLSDLKPAEMGNNGTSVQTDPNFFKDAVSREWNARCDFYRPLIERLLAPSTN